MACCWFTTFLASLLVVVYTSTCACAISTTPFSSTQIKFWSENVQNKMPTPILKKLSPLTQNDCDLYTNNNVKFSADSRFCSMAKLSCGSAVLESSLRPDHALAAAYSNAYGQVISSNIQLALDQKNADPFSFFRINSTLKINGNPVHIPNLKDSLPGRAFLPPQIASKIPLNIKDITRLFPAGAATKQTIEKTLYYCNAAAIKGEVKSCPKSLEEMIDFSKSALGGNRLISLTSKSTQGSNTQLTINNLKKFNADKIVACHEAFLPFAAYFCHSLPSTSLYSVDLVEPKTGAPVNTLVAICHMDTSAWPENHVAFKILKLRPGQGEACHWFTQLDLAWILHTE
ncbi:polygalacturonase-1 non-catalytic subunit beta-like [Henckelia pumila]|uniref:polygalacturonase-1 non-catalytic subunit beta-like n=1 Tax=Henckelia pumila TaxID=405737 RepID=UPI003C6E3972